MGPKVTRAALRGRAGPRVPRSADETGPDRLEPAAHADRECAVPNRVTADSPMGAPRGDDAGQWADRRPALESLRRRVAADPAPWPAPDRGGLPESLRSGLEVLGAVRMDGVRVHRDSDRPARLGALAYTEGSDIYLGPGQATHLPHEA